MAWKRNQDDRERVIKKCYKRLKKIKQEQANLELNYYVQKKIMEYPESYMEEIRKDIENFKKEP